jgi:hypothetical protein
MSSGSYKQAEVQCGLYKYDDGYHRITCDGIIDDSSVALIFHKREDFEKQIEIFCCKHYKNCEIYRMLMENKYAE